MTRTAGGARISFRLVLIVRSVSLPYERNSYNLRPKVTLNLQGVQDESDVIKLISRCHARNGYNVPNPKDWAVLAKVSALEIEQDAEAGDKEHFFKEMADLAFVAIHGIYVNGRNPNEVLRARLDENMKKDLNGRPIEYYVAKIRELESKLGVL